MEPTAPGPEPAATESQDTTSLREGYAHAVPFGAEISLEAKRAPVEWAVIVNHGMGQQVHFETLEQVAVAIRNAEIRERKSAEPIFTRAVKLNTLDGRSIELVRAEMTVVSPNGNPHGVHVYESYWAPLTEGRVTLRDVLGFLGEAALNGFSYLIRHFGRFDRWAFGAMRRFPIRGWLTTLKLVFALFLLFLPMVLATFLAVTQSVFVIVAALRGVVSSGGSDSPAMHFPLRFLTPYLVGFEICVALFVVGTVFLPKLYRSGFLASESFSLVVFRFATRAVALVLSLGAIVGVVAVELLLFRRDPDALRFFEVDNPWALSSVWCVAIVAAFISRWFLVQFIGDVAAYVSAHKLSKFDELRQSIQKCVLDVMGAVYAARDPQEFAYKKIIVVGHSLGSVISFDLLNQLVLEDELASSAPSRTRNVSLDISTRTRLLLTFGSPLDKIAYLFRVKKSTDELRESAIAAWQPLMRDYKFRPQRWLNLYSWMDLFSAPLHFYDNPANSSAGGPKRIKNRIDWLALAPIVAHTEYWTDPILGDSLYKEIR